MDLQSLTAEISDALIPGNLKPTSVVSFDGNSDPREHVITIIIQMDIIGVDESLK